MYSFIFIITWLNVVINGEDVLIHHTDGPIDAIEGQGNIGYYRMGDCMRFMFTVKFHSWCTQDNWCSVFHGGDDSSLTTQVNQRMPGVWLQNNAESTDKFHIVFSTTNSGNPTKNVGLGYDLALDTDYVFDISVTQSTYKIIINGQVIVNQAYPTHCVAGETCNGVRVGEATGSYQDLTPFQIGQGLYGNDYVGLPGTVSDIKIYSCDEECSAGGLAISKMAHACRCVSGASCDDSASYCNSMDFVLKQLSESRDQTNDCPDDFTCCCSCPNCDDPISV
eukprot:128629_1